MQYARMLGMDPVHDSEFVWIADEMARAELPPGWAEVAAKGGGIAFLDTSTQIVSDEHPTASYYRKLFERHRRESGRADSPPQPSIETLEARMDVQRRVHAPDDGAIEGSASASDSSLDSDDSDYAERLARRRARSRRRRSSGSYSDSDSDKENEADRRLRARRQKADRKSVRQQIMEKAEQKSAGPVKRKTARDRVMDKAAEMSAAATAQQEQAPAEERAADMTSSHGDVGLDPMALNQRAAGRVKGRHDRAATTDSDASDEDTARLRQEQKAAQAKREQKQKRRESLATAKERRHNEKLALRREREAEHARQRQQQEEQEAQEEQEKARAMRKREKFRRDMVEEYNSKKEEFRESYAKDHPAAVQERRDKEKEEERQRKLRQQEEDEALRQAEESARSAAEEAERARLAKQLRKEQRRQKRAMAGYYNEGERSSHRDDPNGRRRKKRGHRRRAGDEELQERQEEEWRRHAQLLREEEEAKEKAKAKRRTQAELDAALEAMREVFGQDRDEKLLTMWLAEGMYDVAAAINIGLAHEQKAKEQRQKESERPDTLDDPIDAALDGIALKLAETTHTTSGQVPSEHAEDEDMEPEEQAALEALRKEVEDFDTALDSHNRVETVEEKRARKEERRMRKLAAKEAKRAASAEEKTSPPKVKKKLGMFGRMFGRKKKQDEEQGDKKSLATDASSGPMGDGTGVAEQPEKSDSDIPQAAVKVRSESNRSGRSTGSEGSDKDDSGGLAIGDPCEVYSQSQEEWVQGSVTEIGHRQVAVHYGDRARAIDLADPQLSDYFRAPNLRMLKPLRSSSTRSKISSQGSHRDPRNTQYEVGDPCEMFSESQGSWIAGFIIEIKKNKLAVEYGDRMRVVDLDDPKLWDYFKPKRLRSPSRRSRTPQFSVGDPCEVYSRSGDKWQQGVVTEVGRRKIAVEYGDRTRAIDLTDPELTTYFRAPNLNSSSSVHGLFHVGDVVEIYSQSQQDWVKGAVIEVKGQKIAIEYDDRMRVVDLGDPQLKEYLRSDKLRQFLASGSDSSSELSKQTEMGTQQGGSGAGGLAAILRQDPSSAFAIAQQKLKAQKQEIDALETKGFKGVAAKALDLRKKHEEAVAEDFWAGGLQPQKNQPEVNPTDSPDPQLTDGNDVSDEKDAEAVPTKSGDGAGSSSSVKSASYATDDPVLANAKSLLAAMPDLDALQKSLLTRSTPSVFHSDSDDDELTAEAGSRPVSRETTALTVVPGAKRQDIVIPDEATVAAQAAMAEQRAKIDAMLHDLEEKAKADEELLRAECAVVIQMAYRRHLVRCRIRRAVKIAQMKKRESVRKIWRGWQYRKRRTAAREWRKSLWEVRRAEKRALVIHQKRQAVAARQIQACYRGYLVREGHPTLGDPRVGRMAEAAKVFQKYWAGKFERRRKAIFIQAVWRGYWCRKTVKPGMDVLTGQRSQAALMIQGRQRMRIAKQEQTKRVIAILILQRGMKRYYDVKMAKSTVLQNAYRRRMENKRRHAYFILRRLIWTNLHVRGLEEVKNAHKIQAALTMQRMMRGKAQQNEFLIMKAAVLRIQRNYRGKLGRAQYQVLNKQRYKERGEKFLWAVERLQACFRGKRMRRNMHDYFLQVASVVQIQRTWRGWKCRHDMRAAVDRWCSAMAIQSAVRFFLFRKRARLAIHRREFLAKKAKEEAQALYLHQIVAIQSRFRGNKGRKVAEEKWRALNDEFAECYRINRAIVRIQRSWRAHDAHRRAYALAARIAAAIIVQRAWRQHLNRLRQSQEWSKMYNPLQAGMPDEDASRSGSAGSKRSVLADSVASSAASPTTGPRAKRGGSAATAQSAAQSVAQTVSESVHSVMSDGLSEHAREERDAARIEQNLWVREHLNVQTIWMKDESQVAANRESDSNMAQFFYKRAKPLAAVRCLESALRQQPASASVATRCTININIATVLSQLNEFSKASDVLESSIGLLVADVKAQERVEGERRGSDSQSARETAVPKNSERAFALTALAVCYHNLAVQKLFLDSPAAAIACAAAALRLTSDTRCLASKHPWLTRMERTVEAARQYQEEGGIQQNFSPRPKEATQPSAAAYKANKTPFGPFHDAPREYKKKNDGQSKRGRAVNMRASIKQQKAGRRGNGKISPPAPAGKGDGGPMKKRGRNRGKRNSMPTPGPHGGFPPGRPMVERLPHIDPDAPASVLRHSGREETMGEYSVSVTAHENSKAATGQNKWSYLESDGSRMEPVRKPRALRRVAPRGRTPLEYSSREPMGRPVRGGSAGSARGPRSQQHHGDDALDHRGRFISR